MSKPFLLLQLRPETIASDDEYRAFLRATGLAVDELARVRMDEVMPDIHLDDYAGVIVGGGPSNVSSHDDKKYDYQKVFEPKLKKLVREIVDRDFPYFGECYGLGVLADVLGGRVSTEKYGEGVGAVTITIQSDDPLLADLPREFRAFVGHKEACQDVPPDAALLTSSLTCPIQMIRAGRNVYATQFHPELDSHGLEVRINIYKHAGYFPPQDAEKLIEMGHRETIMVPVEILRRFVGKYRGN